MAKDQLASGQRSATFSAGQAEADEPIEFHGTVAVEDAPVELNWQPKLENEKPAPKSLEELAALYEPMNDRVLLRRVTEDNKRLVDLPDAYKLESDLGLVISVGTGMLVNGQLVPIPLKLGDKVRVGHYAIEDLEVEGETLMLVSAYDVRIRIKA